MKLFLKCILHPVRVGNQCHLDITQQIPSSWHHWSRALYTMINKIQLNLQEDQILFYSYRKGWEHATSLLLSVVFQKMTHTLINVCLPFPPPPKPGHNVTIMWEVVACTKLYYNYKGYYPTPLYNHQHSLKGYYLSIIT